MWEHNDKQNYANHVNQNLGQICNDEFAVDIRRYAADINNRTFLEIGTWNGLGSTKAFSEGFAQRPTTTHKGEEEEKYVFYSLECNKDKCADAARLYAGNPRINILNEVIWNQEPADFYDVFPQCASNPTLKMWHEVDMMNMQKCSVFLDRPDIPPVFDVVLLDGGEFTTYYEFQLLKNRCKILMLDDVNVDKCTKIVQEIRTDPRWRVLKHSNVRNGYLIAERVA
jgi:hypothetical protein